MKKRKLQNLVAFVLIHKCQSSYPRCQIVLGLGLESWCLHEMNDFVLKKNLEDIVCIGVQFILDYDLVGFGLVQFNLYLWKKAIINLPKQFVLDDGKQNITYKIQITFHSYWGERTRTVMYFERSIM